jgi:hypothetical protein
MQAYVEYLKVKDFSDLLKTNLKFFKGELPETYYYYAPWGKGEDQINYDEAATQNLIKLNDKYRIFTTNCQSCYNNYSDYTNYENEIINRRSYLISYMEQETFEKINKKLLNDNRIWTIFILKKKEKSFIEHVENMFYIFNNNYIEVSSLDKNKKRIILTLEYGSPYYVWTRDIEAREEFESCYENVKNIIKDMVYCLIVCKKWDTRPSADTILLEHLEHIESC